MGTRTIKYSNSEFYMVLNQRVQKLLRETKTQKTGGCEIQIKAFILLTLWFGIYGLILYLGRGHPNITYFLYFLWGLTFAGVGFNIMHDAGHGTFSSNERVNYFMFLTLVLMGASHFLWDIKHNRIHHTDVNTHLDDDIETGGAMRLSPNQPRKKFHRFQAFYAFLFYSILHIYWVVFTDSKKMWTKKINKTPLPKGTLTTRRYILFFLSKIMYFVMVLILPYQIIGWPAVVGFIILEMTIGITISLVFQLAHVVEKSQFNKAVNGKMSHSLSEQQLFETCNFQTDSKILSWYVGGLNFQVEHHLFPKISHVHYPKIQPVVKETCEEFDLPYNENTLNEAIVSHIRLLDYLGNNDDLKTSPS